MEKTAQHLSSMSHAEKTAKNEEKIKELISTAHPRQAQYVTETVPSSMQRTFAEAFAGNSKANAIKAKCLSCANFQRDEITSCAAMICPLHSVRPFQAGGEIDE